MVQVSNHYLKKRRSCRDTNGIMKFDGRTDGRTGVHTDVRQRVKLYARLHFVVGHKNKKKYFKVSSADIFIQHAKRLLALTGQLACVITISETI